MSAVAPKTFHQLRFFSTFLVATVGFYQGVSQKSKNQAAWDTYYANKFKAQAAKNEAEAAAKRPAGEISELVPAELHDLVRELTK